MSLEVLQNRQQIATAREELDKRDLSALASERRIRLAKLVSRLRLGRPLVVGDRLKSWDLLRTVDFIERNVGRNDPILDIGAYASEVLLSLRKAGFRDLTGVDLNPKLSGMPFNGEIRYVKSDFMRTPFAGASFAAITAISVIEHGYDPQRLLAEVSRLLRPGGYFLASTDYWRTKLDTAGRRIFDMSWLIFSEEDVQRLFAEAAGHGLVPVGDLRPETGDRAIEHAGFNYTFAWLALRKAA